MYLHDAIIKVLTITAIPMTPNDIAQLVNSQKLYKRKDGQPIPTSQISARVNNYPQLFYKIDSKIGLVSRRTTYTNSKPVVENSELPIKDLAKSIDDTWDVCKISGIREAGFLSQGTLGMLLRQGLPSNTKLNQCGLYAITIPFNYRPGYFDQEKAKNRGNVINPWSAEKLKAKWVANVDLVYYGIAGAKSHRPLKKRLNDLLRHGNGKITDRGPHKGGEILWQLLDYKDFTLWVLPTNGPPVPRDYENQILQKFCEKMGKLPFANRQL